MCVLWFGFPADGTENRLRRHQSRPGLQVSGRCPCVQTQGLPPGCWIWGRWAELPDAWNSTAGSSLMASRMEVSNWKTQRCSNLERLIFFSFFFFYFLFTIRDSANMRSPLSCRVTTRSGWPSHSPPRVSTGGHVLSGLDRILPACWTWYSRILLQSHILLICNTFCLQVDFPFCGEHRVQDHRTSSESTTTPPKGFIRLTTFKISESRMVISTWV